MLEQETTIERRAAPLSVPDLSTKPCIHEWSNANGQPMAQRLNKTQSKLKRRIDRQEEAKTSAKKPKAGQNVKVQAASCAQ
mmetsp:Transcript_53829/g.114958  ORF Transcript_53829/g.114958 Transcript_53829/m.114958 type:complete len:81 (-) Transcript_53829:333-575(-)